jgi:hypothetical protein
MYQIRQLKRQNIRFARGQSDERRLMCILSTRDVSGLRRLMAAAVKRGLDAHGIIKLIECSLEGKYHPQGGFSQRDLDIAFIVKSIGGPRLMYVLNHSHGLPSAREVSRKAKATRILTSVGVPSAAEAHFNIGSVLNPSTRPAPVSLPHWLSAPGNALMVDDIALDPSLRHDPWRNCAVGLGREHAASVETKITGMDAIDKLQDALSSDSNPVSLATTATVVAVGTLAHVHSHWPAVPIIISPSSGSETSEALVAWLQTVIDAWYTNPHGSTLWGPLWTIATDGASVFRMARFALCSAIEIPIDDPLGRTLWQIPGLRRRTSKEGIVNTCDYRHAFKRIGAGCRNVNGLMVGTTMLTRPAFIDHLASLPDISADDAEILLDPLDKQNVPKATKLLQCLRRIREASDITDLTSIEQKERRAVVFYARVMDFFVRPFIDVTLSLSDQVVSLLTYAHLIFAMYRINKSGFMTAALYADTQAIVEAIIITIARMQLIDGELCYYAIADGQDRLEGTFCRIRGLNHDRNVDAQTLSYKAAIATELDAAFLRNPDLDRGHDRSNLVGAEGVDKVNPEAWKGKLPVGQVELPKLAVYARHQATSLLGIYMSNVWQEDLDALLNSDGINFACPLGQLIGVSLADDDSHLYAEPVEPASNSPTVWPLMLDEDLLQLDSSELEPHEPFDLEGMLSDSETEPDLEYTSPAGVLQMTDLPKVDFADKDTPRTLDVNGKACYKSSLVASLSTPDARRVSVRTLRVQGVTLQNLLKRRATGSHHAGTDGHDATDYIRSTDLIAALVRSGSGDICLCVFSIVGFTNSPGLKVTHTQISWDDFDKNIEKTYVVAQALELEWIDSDQPRWEWTHNHLSMSSKVVPGQAISQKNYAISIPARSIHPLAPEECRRTSPSSHLESRATWSLDAAQLDTALDDLWADLEPESEDIFNHLLALPTVSISTPLPYSKDDGERLDTGASFMC